MGPKVCSRKVAVVQPQVHEILESIRWTLKHQVLPELDDPYAESLAYTMVNMLRHTQVRIQLEHRATRQDVAELREILADARRLLPAPDDSGTSLSEAIGSTLEGAPPLPDAGPSLSDLDAEREDLRELLDQVIHVLDTEPSRRQRDDARQQLRDRIRTHLTKSLERQSPWMLEAFQGRRR